MSAEPRIELNSTSSQAIDGRQIRAVAFQNVRLEYLRTTLTGLGLSPAGSSALVVGGGRGVLSRGLAHLGFDVVSVDPSHTATTAASEAAVREGLQIEHRTAPAEAPDVAEGAFDIAYYADTFEITSDLPGVIEQAARSLRPGGLLFYDTVNRTLLSRLIYLGAFQGIPMTRIMPPGRYSAARLRRPVELAKVLAQHGLANQETVDFKPKDAPSLVKAVLARRRGEITDDEISSKVAFILNPGGNPVVTYLGYARKS
jgi:2-polyprenyl-6-hydroxyphenyl methylase/3-demethylubiquinone-9 3-methyltransferase